MIFYVQTNFSYVMMQVNQPNIFRSEKKSTYSQRIRVTVTKIIVKVLVVQLQMETWRLFGTTSSETSHKPVMSISFNMIFHPYVILTPSQPICVQSFNKILVFIFQQGAVLIIQTLVCYGLGIDLWPCRSCICL